MRAYLDTSALLKLFIDEPGSEELVQRLLRHASVTSRITYVEARAALARREREAPMLRAEWADARRRLNADWAGFGIIEISAPLVDQAANLADASALRAYDAMQLAACHALQASLAAPVVFYGYDIRLNRAARALGVQVPQGAAL